MNPKTIIGKISDEVEGFCLENPKIVKEGSLYRISELNILIDRKSMKNLFSRSKTFSAIKVPEKNYFILKPIPDTSKYSVEEYKEPKQIGKGTYGMATLYSHGIVTKESLIPGINADTIKEISIYKLHSQLSCLPELRDFELLPVVKLDLEAGVETLHSYIAKEQPGLTMEKKSIMFRLAKCMAAISSQGIIHADLKPENIILNDQGKVQIIDWGLAQIDHSYDQGEPKNTFVQTIWYRAPELLTEKPLSTYSNKIDIFSLGLIFLELLTCKPICTGRTPPKQIYTYLNVLLGMKPDDLKYDFINLDVLEIKLREDNRIDISDEMKKIVSDEELLDLVSRMLEFNYRNRISYGDILEHEFFNGYMEDIPEYPIFTNNIVGVFDATKRNSMNNVLVIPVNRSWDFFKKGEDFRAKVFKWMMKYCVKNKLSLETMCSTFQLLDLTVLLYPNITKNLKLVYLLPLYLSCRLYEPSCTFGFYEIHEIVSKTEYVEQKTFMEKLNECEDVLIRILGGNLLIPNMYSYWSKYNGVINRVPKNYEAFYNAYLEPYIYSVPFNKIYQDSETYPL